MQALIIIDMQDAYFKTPNLSNQRDALAKRINSLVTMFHMNSDIILNIRTVHLRDKTTWTLNMLEDDQGFAFDDSAETGPIASLRIDNAIQLSKTRDNAFHDTNLLQVLRSHDVTRITLAGVSAHSCIFHTAAAAYAYNYPTVLAASAIGDEDDSQKRTALEYLKREYRQSII